MSKGPKPGCFCIETEEFHENSGPALFRMLNKGVPMLTMRDVFAVVLFGGFCLLSQPVNASECTDFNWDIWKVAKSLQQGLSKETLLMHLDGSRNELTPERMLRIRELIDEVYLLEQTEAQPWFEKNYRDCSKEGEA